MEMPGVDSQQVLQELETMSPSMLSQVLTFMRYLKFQGQTDCMTMMSSGCYDFSDLAGKLLWRGDAVATQRQLRDEW